VGAKACSCERPKVQARDYSTMLRQRLRREPWKAESSAVRQPTLEEKLDSRPRHELYRAGQLKVAKKAAPRRCKATLTTVAFF
jgi:hypothetical protein